MAEAQFQLEYVDYPVQINGRTLSYPFAGGMNSVQFNELDFNLDGVRDLVLFDRSSEMITTILNAGDIYEIMTPFEQGFPEIQHWMILADFNLDGRNDLFTFSNLGVKVFENTEVDNRIIWRLVADPLTTEGNSGEVNILFNPGDIPAILDMDGDGDLDILHYDFSTGDHIVFHKNFSIERTGNAGLDFALESEMFGNIDTCDCDDFAFQGTTCHEGSKILHVGGKTLLAYSQNEGTAVDLVIGQEDCPNLSFLENIGDYKNPNFDSFDSTFPTFSESLNMTGFAAAYYLDVTFDGEKDILISQNVRTDDSGSINFEASSFIYENTGNNEFAEGQAFLQNEMIDVGSNACPAFADIDGDGLEDLVISSEGSSLSYYRQATDGFHFSTNNLFDFSAANLSNVKIQFVHFDDDFNLDLVIKASSQGDYSLYVVYNESRDGSIWVDISALQELNVSIEAEDDFFFHDLNEDGRVDLLIGNRFGELDYYEGAPDGLSFTLSERNVLETTQTNISNLSISTADLNLDGKSDLITTRRSGKMEVFSDFHENRSEGQFEILNQIDSMVSTRLGRISKPAVGWVNDRLNIAVGTAQGGVRLFEVVNSERPDQLTLEVFPNPSQSYQYSFESNTSNGILTIMDLWGRVVFEHVYQNTSVMTFDFSQLTRGIYIAQFNAENKSAIAKVLVN